MVVNKEASIGSPSPHPNTTMIQQWNINKKNINAQHPFGS